MSCIYCTSQPNDVGPCSCSHAPCIHDRNTTIEDLQKKLNKILTIFNNCNERVLGDYSSRAVIEEAFNEADLEMVNVLNGKVI